MLCHNLISLQIFTLLIKITVRGTLTGFSVAYDECREEKKDRQRQNMNLENGVFSQVYKFHSFFRQVVLISLFIFMSVGNFEFTKGEMKTRQFCFDLYVD